MPKKPLSPGEKSYAIGRARALLVEARDLLKLAGARQTLPRVRSALRSADGAVRNASRFAAMAPPLPELTAEDIKCPCGGDPKGVIEEIDFNVAQVDGFKDGALSYGGYTDINYDGQASVLSPRGNLMLRCNECGMEYEAPEGLEVK